MHQSLIWRLPARRRSATRRLLSQLRRSLPSRFRPRVAVLLGRRVTLFLDDPDASAQTLMFALKRGGRAVEISALPAGAVWITGDLIRRALRPRRQSWRVRQIAARTVGTPLKRAA